MNSAVVLKMYISM